MNKRTFVFSLAAVLAFLSSSAAQWVYLGGPGGCSIRSLAALGSYLFAGTQFGVFLSSDGGNHWTAAGPVGSAALGDASILQLIASGTNLFACTRRGVFLSTDNGAAGSRPTPAFLPYRSCSVSSPLGPASSPAWQKAGSIAPWTRGQTGCLPVQACRRMRMSDVSPR